MDDNARNLVNFIYFNLSGVYDGKEPAVDLTDIHGTNCYLDDAAGAEIQKRIDAMPGIHRFRQLSLHVTFFHEENKGAIHAVASG